MILDRSYETRSGGFNYISFVADALTKLSGKHANKTSLYRMAVSNGADQIPSKTVIKELSIALNTVANRQGFKRFKVRGELGYFFKCVELVQSNNRNKP
ncbi:hypothetical protein JI57_04560 [Psychromonas sp. PRT-SC03]|nr:hypothetical protein JI57_04560 [Psychromonas sp. PRT-SC03]